MAYSLEKNKIREENSPIKISSYLHELESHYFISLHPSTQRETSLWTPRVNIGENFVTVPHSVEMVSQYQQQVAMVTIGWKVKREEG